MSRSLVVQAVRFLAVAAIVAAITFLDFRVVKVNSAMAGFTYLLAVLIVAASWELRHAIVMSALATLCYNFFFFPPVGKFTIAEPQNWVALFTFLVTAVIATQLAERARRQASAANQRRREVERLYAFSQQLLLTENVFELLNAIPRYIVDYFGVTGAAMFLENKQKTYLSDISLQATLTPEQLKVVSSRGEPLLDRNTELCCVPLRMGVRQIGSLGMVGCQLSRETLEAIGSLAATAIERASTVEKLTKTEAARESERLRSLLLDSVTHEFRTPLTSIKASAEMLLGDGLPEEDRKEYAAIINEESDRLNRLVGEAAEVAQLDAHQVELHFEPHAIREAVDLALQRSQHLDERHKVEVNSAADLPAIRMDVERIAEVIAQLLENADKYSPAGTPIHITTEARNNLLVTSVADHGPGIDDLEQAMIFEKFYRGRNQRVAVRGTGMGLAIAKAIVELHGGTIGVTSQPGHGSVFSFSLPLVQ